MNSSNINSIYIIIIICTLYNNVCTKATLNTLLGMSLAPAPSSSLTTAEWPFQLE